MADGFGAMEDRTIKGLTSSLTRSFEPDGSHKARLEASFTREWHAISSPQAMPKADTLDSEIKHHLHAVGELAQELDQLFEEMGQQITVLKVGVRHECRIAAGLTRKLEIKVDGDDVTDIQMACRLDENKHLVDQLDKLDEETRLAPEPFALGICDTARQALDEGPYWEWLEPDVSQSLRFGIEDSSSFFVNLLAKKECHVIFISKAISRAGTNRSKFSLSGGAVDSTLGSTGWTLEMQKLMEKVREHKDTKQVRKKTRRVPKTFPNGLGRTRVEGRKKGLSFGELVFPEGRPAREQHQIEYAQLKVLQLWRRRDLAASQGKVWAKLPSELPQKLAQKLLKTRQERSVFTSIAIAGGFAFFLQRQRQLHVMRSRTALRQLAWYKALFSASRFLILVIYLNKGRQEAQAKRSGTLTAVTPRRMSMRRRSTDAEVFFQESSPLAMLRKYLRRPGSKSPSAKRPEGAGSPVRPRMLRANVEPGSLAHHLLLQGFDLRPPESRLARRGAAPARLAHQSQFAKGLAARLGRQIQAAPKVVSNSSEHSQMQQAIEEVSQSTLMMTVSPRELGSLALAKNKANVQLMGVEHFEQFYMNAVQRAADELVKQRAREAEQQEQDKTKRPRIIKRYRLRFLEEESDLPWLPLQETLMLVIRGKSMFLTPTEQALYDSKMKNVNEERRAAARLPGFFAPLEAVLLCHPVMVGLTTKLQRDLRPNDGVMAWKAQLFQGRYEKLSSRAIVGHQFLSDDRESHMLRTCVNVGGPFNASPAKSTLDPPAVIHDQFLATTTSSGTVWRAFGSEEDAQTRYRMEDPIRQLPTLTEPRELRLEDACRARSAQRAQSVVRHLGERTADMVADGEARSQRRFHSWAMSSLVPEEAQLWKAKVLPFFDEFASTCSSSRRSPGCTAESFFDTKASKTSETWNSGISMKTVGTPSGSKVVKLPTTPEEVGQWLSSHDALQSVTGDAMKSACGWSSGFRKDPMSMEEVLNVRILERSNAAFAKRKKEPPNFCGPFLLQWA